MLEWKKHYEFNSFNSWKGLLYSEWYKAIVAGKFLPPIEASVDLAHACNLNCKHCNASRYLRGSYHVKNKIMDKTHALNLISFLADWGVKGFCFGGGGESTLNPALQDCVLKAKSKNKSVALITNAVSMDKNLIDTLAVCSRFVGCSIDAATPESYFKGKGADCFSNAISNMTQLVKKVKDYRSNCDISYKFLIFSYNQHEIYDACKLAKEIGVKDFHARPADFSHQGMKDKSNVEYDINLVNEQLEKCRELESEDFRVFTITHKFDNQYKPRRDFCNCYAMPVLIQCCADGNVYACLDQRMNKSYLLGSHYPNPQNILNFWGGEKHKELVFGNTPKKCSTRCTIAPYNRQCEFLFANNNDPMCWEFT
jgi:MoaA/NifB/PqqE/SkfB family radical SAM enzyme